MGRAGHVAVWAGAYVIGALIAGAVVAGVGAFGSEWRDLVAMWCVGATGVGVYLVDRVKLADRWLDPADARAHPDRWAFLHPRRRLLRAVALAAGLSAIAGACVLAPWLVLVVIGAFVGVLAYAGLPPDPHRPPRRLKDMLVVKNLAVGMSIAALSVLALKAARDVPLASLITPGFVLTGIVFADAALCDLDDMSSDAAFGTRTIPVTTSRRVTWMAAMVIQALALCGALLWRPGAPMAIFAGGMVVTAAALLGTRVARLRDLVDARLALVSATALLVAHVT